MEEGFTTTLFRVIKLSCGPGRKACRNTVKSLWTHSLCTVAVACASVGQVQANEIVNNIHFRGHYYDEESGLYYNMHRYYNPKTGRYLTQDPISVLGGLNLYSFARQNPVRFSDPTGLLTVGDALSHYVHGGGESLNVAFGSLDTQDVQPSDFEAIRKNTRDSLGCCSEETINIEDVLPYRTPGIQRIIYGHVLLMLRGKLQVERDCSWCFVGFLSALPDRYDFNRSTHRTWFGEISTILGGFLPGDPYTINFVGFRTVLECGP